MKTINLLQSAFFVLLLLQFTSITLAQNNNTHSGFYINNAGDAVKGKFINYKEWNKNPKKVDFIEDNNNNTVVLTPQNCKSFSIDGKDTYITYNGTRLTNPIELNTNALQVDTTDIVQNISVFLRLVYTQGAIKLWILNDKERVNYFIQNNNEQITELIHKLYAIENIVTYSDQYKKQLRAVLATNINLNDKINKQIENTTYTEKAFKQLFNNAFSINASANNIKYKSNFFITGGISFNNFKASGNSEIAQAKTTYSSNVSPLIHLGANFYSQRGFGKFFFMPQLKFFNYNHSGDYTSTSVLGIKMRYYTNYKTNLIINPGLNIGYTLTKTDNVEWNVTAGLGAFLLINNKEKIQIDNLITNTTTYQTSKMQGFCFNSNIETGVVFAKHIIVMAGYSLPTITTNYNNYKGLSSSVQIVAGYRF